MPLQGSVRRSAETAFCLSWAAMTAIWWMGTAVTAVVWFKTITSVSTGATSAKAYAVTRGPSPSALTVHTKTPKATLSTSPTALLQPHLS